MKNLTELIKEDKSDNKIDTQILNALGGDDDSIWGSIIKRVKGWDNKKHDWSRKPMFLVSDNGDLGWYRTKFMKAKNSEGKEINTYDGYLNDYIKKNNKNNSYVLGIFINRFFYPIFNIDEFEKIWELIEKD